MGERKIEQYMTVEQVSEMLQMPKATVYQKVAEGLIRTYKPGKKILFDPSDVHAFVKKYIQK